MGLQVAGKGGRIPAALFCGRFSCRAWVYGVQRFRGFLLFVLVTL